MSQLPHTMCLGMCLDSQFGRVHAHQMPKAKKMDPSLTMVGPATEGSSKSRNFCHRFFFCSNEPYNVMIMPRLEVSCLVTKAIHKLFTKIHLELHHQVLQCH